MKKSVETQPLATPHRLSLASGLLVALAGLGIVIIIWRVDWPHFFDPETPKPAVQNTPPVDHKRRPQSAVAPVKLENHPSVTVKPLTAQSTPALPEIALPETNVIPPSLGLEANPNVTTSAIRAEVPNSSAPFVKTGMSAIRGHIYLRGTPPPEIPLPIALDPNCGKFENPQLTTRHYLVNTNSELADTFVYLRSGLEGKTFAVPETNAFLDQASCAFTPYVLGLQTGQTLAVRNFDPLLHNIHVTRGEAERTVLNQAQFQNTPALVLRFTEPELFVRFKCDVHPWMFAYVGVASHPFFAVSGTNGASVIPLPPPGHYVIEALHRKAGRLTQETVIESTSVTLNFVLEVPK